MITPINYRVTCHTIADKGGFYVGHFKGFTRYLAKEKAIKNLESQGYTTEIHNLIAVTA